MPAPLALLLAALAAPPLQEAEPPGPVDVSGAPPASAESAPHGVGGDGFPVFVWRRRHRDEPPPAGLFEPFGGTNVERGEDPPWVVDGGWDFYVGHAPGRDALHLDRDAPAYAELRRAWLETRDPARLVREPCLTDPLVRAALLDQLARSLGSRDGRHGLGISLGDEVGLTPYGDPLDLCRSPTCEAAWRELLRETLGPVPEVGEPAPTTDEALRALARGDDRTLGLWLLRRRFHHGVVHGILSELAQRARALAPGTPVGVLGLIGTTAFGGVELPELLATLDFFEAYPVGDARELLYTLRQPGQRALATLVLAEGPAAASWGAWEHWLRGGDGLVLWSDAELEDDPATRERLARAVADVRALGPALGRRPRPAGLAVVDDPDSQAFAWLLDARGDGDTWPNRLAGFQERNGTRERAVRAWLRLAEDSGLLPGAVPIESVGLLTAERFPLLVLAHQHVLSDGQVNELAGYLRAGGRLIVDGPLGTRRPDGTRRAEDVRERLARFAAGVPGRVLAPPPWLERYEVERLRSRSTRALDTRLWLAAELAEAGVEPAWRLAGRSRELPWIGIRLEREDGATGGVLLPNLETPADRAASLRDRPLALDLPAGSRVEWIRPAGQEPDARAIVLPAGEPAIFLVRAD